jgi:hypothetical protein
MAHNRQHSRPVLKDEIRHWCPKYQQWLSLDEMLYLKSLNSKEKVTAPTDDEIRSQELLSRGPTRVILGLPGAKISFKKMKFDFNIGKLRSAGLPTPSSAFRCR